MRYVIALALALLATGAADAEETGWYGGIDTSRGRMGLNAAELGFGYRFSAGFQVEGRSGGRGFGYAPGLEFGTHPLRDRGYALSGTGTWRMGDHWSLYGRAGVGDSRDELAPGLRMGTEPGAGIMVGAGATYEFSRRIYGRLSWSRDPARSSDFNFYSLGVGVRF